MGWIILLHLYYGFGLNEMTDLSDQLGQTACPPLAEFEFGCAAWACDGLGLNLGYTAHPTVGIVSIVALHAAAFIPISQSHVQNLPAVFAGVIDAES
jgi:hypothetical protein